MNKPVAPSGDAPSATANKFSGVEMKVLSWPPLPGHVLRKPFAERKAERVAARRSAGPEGDSGGST
jgi:hypothetical protein